MYHVTTMNLNCTCGERLAVLEAEVKRLNGEVLRLTEVVQDWGTWQ